MRGQRHAPAALYPQERPGTHFTVGWVGPRACLDRCGKSRPPPPGFDPRIVQPVANMRNKRLSRNIQRSDKLNVSVNSKFRTIHSLQFRCQCEWAIYGLEQLPPTTTAILGSCCKSTQHAEGLKNLRLILELECNRYRTRTFDRRWLNITKDLRLWKRRGLCRSTCKSMHRYFPN